MEKKQLESGEIDEYRNTYKIEELEIQMETYLMKFEQNIQDIQDVVTAEGGDETDGLLEQNKEKEKEKLYLEGVKYVHFAGPKRH